jgi:hypothetical protein
MLEKISVPVIHRACENHPDTSARFLLMGHPMCVDCAEQTLILAEIGAVPSQPSFFDECHAELRRAQ